MRTFRTDRGQWRSKARSVSIAVLLPLLSTGTGGLIGWGLSECPSLFRFTPKAHASSESADSVRLESLRRSRLAFLNLGFDRKSSFIKGLDEEIAASECGFKKLLVVEPLSETANEVSAPVENGGSWGKAGSTLGSILGLVLGILGAWLYGSKLWRGANRLAPRDGVGRRLQIPILGAIPEGAFKER